MTNYVMYKILINYIMGPPPDVFFSTSVYFVNDNTDLTDNQFYPSAKRIWLCIRLNNASLSGPALDLQKKRKKKIISPDEAHFDLGGYANKQNCGIWGTENPHAYIEKPTHPKRVTGEDVSPEA